MNYDNIGKFIKLRRTSLGLTQKDLAKKLNITDKAISKWERGLSLPDISLLKDLSTNLECTITEILNGELIETIDKEKLDNYTINTIDYSYKNTIKSINKVIIVIILTIITYIGVCNISSIIKVNRKFRNQGTTYEMYQPYQDKALENIAVIRKNQGKYTIGHYELILDGLNNLEKGIKNNVYLSYKDKINFTSLELLMLKYTGLKNNYLAAMGIIEQYYDIDYKKYSMTKTRGYETLVNEEELFNYFYKYSFSPNYFDVEPVSEIRAVESSLMYKYFLLTEIIMEAGDIHE